MDRPTLIGPDAFRRPAAETPGVDRRGAFADNHVWAGRSRTEAGAWSGWHVHPGHDTYVFQTQGRLRLEFGPGGTESVDGGPGDFVRIPRGVVHREGNPGTEPNEAIVFRVGEGEVLVNVDGP
ncbi:MAG: cupin domain-containing protein [Actinomycetes bacterium]